MDWIELSAALNKVFVSIGLTVIKSCMTCRRALLFLLSPKLSNFYFHLNVSRNPGTNA